MNARPLDYDWVLNIRAQCMNKQVPFQFRQCGTNFRANGKTYRLKTRDLVSQAKKANIDYAGKSESANKNEPNLES